MNTVLINISDENNLRARLKVAAAKRGETMTMLATNALEAVVSREERSHTTEAGGDGISYPTSRSRSG